MIIKEYKGFNNFQNLKNKWKKLVEDSKINNPFVDFNWLFFYIKYFNQDDEITIYTLENNHQLKLIIPYDNKDNSIVNNELIADYIEPLVCEKLKKKDFYRLITHILNKKKLLKIGPQRIFNEKELENFSFSNIYTIQRKITINPCIKISGSFDNYYMAINKKIKQDIRTTQNKLKKIGNTEFFIANMESEKVLLFKKLCQFHTSRQLNKSGNSIFEVTGLKNFFYNLIINHKLKAFKVHLSAIKSQNKIISVSFSIIYNNVFYYWIPSFDKSIKGVSLGKFHIKNLIKYCFENNLNFDFMGGDEKYKLYWSNYKYDIYKFYYFKNFINYKFYSFYFKIYDFLKFFYKKLRK